MPCHSPIYVDNPRAWSTGEKYIPVPCGGCATCQRNRVNSWVFRLMQEDKVSYSSFFITLTYDNENVVLSDNGFPTLVKDHLRLFWKALRKRQVRKIKYYAVGEYGSKTLRPHYHAIVFNVEDKDFFNKCWSKGHVDIGNVSGDSCGYVSGYVNKGTTVPVHKMDDRLREFSNCSKGLGQSYLSDAVVAYHRADLERNFVTLEGGCKIPLPRYYRDKIYSDDDKETQRVIIDEKYLKSDANAEELFYRKFGKDADYHLYTEYNKLGKEAAHRAQRKLRKL